MTTAPRSPAAALLTGDRCGRLRELFDRALEQPEPDRSAWIDAVVPDPEDRAALRLLLAAEAADGPLDQSSAERLARIGDAEDVAADGLVGQRIGAFRLVRLLGQGGMAAVFLGQREGADFSQTVAVKLLRRGLYSALEQRLFRREQQALAALSHPNIAHLIDGGVTEAGIPYLVLEYVDGAPITDYAAQQRLGLPARLRLFVSVCRAVAAAHRQLIVHRDLKPGNILVGTDGQVKLLDFGIAKLLAEADDDEGATRTGLAALTPGYAAPEQYSGAPITMATDVHALGVVLYELLVGARPAAGRTDSSRPSQAAHPSATARGGGSDVPFPAVALRGDLDNIVLKALATEPTRRYATAADLADDIQRHLDQQPVAAHPPSRWYRTAKFVRRHRGSVAVTLALALGLVASLGIALWQAREARAEAANARAEALRATTTRTFIENLFAPVRIQMAEGRTASLRDLVALGASQLDAATDLAPAHRVDLLLMFARLQSFLAETEAALALATRADALAREALPPDSPVALQALFELARARYQNRDLVQAAPLLQEAEYRFAAAGVEGTQLIDLLALLATQANESGRADEALRYAERELEARRSLYRDNAPGMAAGLAGGYNNLGYALEAVGRFDDAIAAYERALALDDRERDPRSLQRSYPLGNLAQAQFNAGRLREALANFNEALAIHAEVALDKPTRSNRSLQMMLGTTLMVLGDLDAAREAAARGRLLAETTPEHDPDRVTARRVQASVALERGEPDEVRRFLAELEALGAPLSELARQRSLARRDMLLAELALLEGQPDEAAARARAGLDGLDAGLYPPFNPPLAKALLAQACASASGPACAGDPHAAAVAAMAEPNNRSHPLLFAAQIAIARSEHLRGDVDGANRRLRAAIQAALDRGVAAGSPRLAQARGWLALAMAHAGDCDQAIAALGQTGAAEPLGSDHPMVAQAQAAYRAAGLCRARVGAQDNSATR